MNWTGPRSRTLGLALLLAGLEVAAVRAQTVSAAPVELVRETVKNEIDSNDPAKFMFREHDDNGHGSQTKLVVQTRDVAAGLLVAINDKPLTEEQRRDELARLDELSHNPDELKKKEKADREDTEHTNRIMRALPDAFIYQPDGVEPSTKAMGNPGDELVRLKFRPNPNYDPPTHTEQVLTGMTGQMLIDRKQHRIALIDGTLEKDVGFGWGILGRLNQGGRFVVQQGTMGTGVWQVTRMNLDFTGKILFFKKLVIKSSQIFSDFREAPPNLTFAQGVELLRKQPEVQSENRPQEPSPDRGER